MSSITSALLVLAPSAQWNLNDDNYSEIEWFSPEIQKPTQEQIDAEIAKQDAQAPLDACKDQATVILNNTDWTSIADVGNPAKANPYLVNQADFISYRSAIRALAVNPVTNPVWPVAPTEQWSTPTGTKS